MKIYSDCAMPWLLDWPKATDTQMVIDMTLLQAGRSWMSPYDVIYEADMIYHRALLRMRPSPC